MKNRVVSADLQNSPHFRLFTELGELLLSLGLSKSEIFETASVALSGLKASGRKAMGKLSSQSNDSLGIAAAAIFKWHRDKRFLTKNARPQSLPISGKKSIEKLILSCEKEADAKSIIAQMIKAKLLEEVGSEKFIPNSACLIPQASHPMASARSVHQLRTLMWSLTGNLSPSKRGPLIEREASVKKLPVRDIPAFRDFSRQQGAALIQTIDEWLESRQTAHAQSSSKGPTIEVGAHIYAYVAPQGFGKV